MCIIMMLPIWHPYAGMAELADALDSGSSESNFMEVQVLLPAPNKRNPNPKGSDFLKFIYWEGNLFERGSHVNDNMALSFYYGN